MTANCTQSVSSRVQFFLSMLPFLLLLFSIRSTVICVHASAQAKFDQSYETVSVVVGKRALLPCYVSIKDTASNGNSPFKVIWMKLNNSSILTMEDRAINVDPRISLLHAYADEWNLQIDDVDEDDAGIYQCVINTGMYKTLMLDVKVPPKIVDELTTEPYPSPIRSGSNFTIKCYAHGKPTPTVRIVSYDQSDNAKVISDQNEVTLYNVSRHTSRRYQCVASNGYPPDPARSFQLTVHYAPELILVFVSTMNDEILSNSLYLDSNRNELRLRCRVVMNPPGKIDWLKDNNILMNENHMHQYVFTYMEDFMIAELLIKNFTNGDQGEYSCTASNSLGINSKSIHLFLASTTTTTAEATITSRTNEPINMRTNKARSSRTKHPKQSRTTILEESNRSTRPLHTVTIMSSQAINTKYQMMTFFLLLFIAAYF